MAQKSNCWLRLVTYNMQTKFTKESLRWCVCEDGAAAEQEGPCRRRPAGGGTPMNRRFEGGLIFKAAGLLLKISTVSRQKTSAAP